MTDTTNTTQHTPALDVNIDGRYIHISVEMVGPREAEQLLALNTHNRNLKDKLVSRLAYDLENANFTFNGATICVSEEPCVLLDGQNRLSAIVASGLAVPLIIVRGLPHSAQEDMDTGATRQFGDVLKLRGEPQAAALAALVRKVTAWKEGHRRSLPQYNASTSHLLRTLNQHPELRDMVQPTRHVAGLCGIPASVVGALWWAFAQIDYDDAEMFFQRLGDGQGLVKGDPIFELRRTIAAERVAGGNGLTVKHMAFTVKAWNAYRAGETVGLYRWRPGGANPEKFPEPK